MVPRRLLRIGSIGALIAALCCFTPLLVVTLGAIGLGAVVGYLDLVLLPVLALCIGIVLYALYRMRRADG